VLLWTTDWGETGGQERERNKDKETSVNLRIGISHGGGGYSSEVYAIEQLLYNVPRSIGIALSIT